MAETMEERISNLEHGVRTWKILAGAFAICTTILGGVAWLSIPRKVVDTLNHEVVGQTVREIEELADEAKRQYGRLVQNETIVGDIEIVGSLMVRSPEGQPSKFDQLVADRKTNPGATLLLGAGIVMGAEPSKDGSPQPSVVLGADDTGSHFRLYPGNGHPPFDRHAFPSKSFALVD